MGGITVLTNLNPFVVGLHFLASIVMVVIATVYLYRVFRGPRWCSCSACRVGSRCSRASPSVVGGDHGAWSAFSPPDRALTPATAVQPATASTPQLMQHVRSWPAYLLLALTVVLAAWAVVGVAVGMALPVLVLLGLELLEVAVGLDPSPARSAGGSGRHRTWCSLRAWRRHGLQLASPPCRSFGRLGP